MKVIKASIPQYYIHQKMDFWLIYDRTKLRSVAHIDSKYNKLKRDGYVFKNPQAKSSALLGLIIIE